MANDRVEAGIAVTKNLGNYESLKLNVGYTTDVRPDETVEEAHERAWTVVDETLEAKLLEASQGLDG